MPLTAVSSTPRFPFYYEIKMAFVVWLLSPYTKGASLLYRKFIHPTLSRREKVKGLLVWHACNSILSLRSMGLDNAPPHLRDLQVRTWLYRAFLHAWPFSCFFSLISVSLLEQTWSPNLDIFPVLYLGPRSQSALCP